MTTAPPNAPYNAPAPVLFLAFARRENTWKLGFTLGHGPPPRERTLAAREAQRLRNEVAQATGRFGLRATAPVVSCSEAGREGCWWQRFWPAPGRPTPVVDSSSLEVKRRQRRATRDAVEVRTLWPMLRRYPHGERHVWRVVNVPAVAAAAQRHRHRDLETLQHESARTSTRLKGWLSRQGRRVASVHTVPEQLDARRLGAGAPVPRGVRGRVLGVSAPYECLGQQMAA